MHFIDLCEIVQFVKASIFFISVHLKISALFEVNDFLSAEVFPAVMDVKIDPGFWTQKKTPFPLSRGHLSLQ